MSTTRERHFLVLETVTDEQAYAAITQFGGDDVAFVAVDNFCNVYCREEGVLIGLRERFPRSDKIRDRGVVCMGTGAELIQALRFLAEPRILVPRTLRDNGSTPTPARELS